MTATPQTTTKRTATGHTVTCTCGYTATKQTRELARLNASTHKAEHAVAQIRAMRNDG